MFDLSGKKALVTGASGGIGGAIARTLHANGAEVVLSGTRKEALDALQKELGERTHVCVARLGEEGSAEKLITDAHEAMGGLDILVNNAGLTRDTLAMRMKDEDWQTVIDVNLTSAFKLIKASLKGMMKQRSGRIINITSVVGVTGNAGQANYAASKAGLIGMSKSLAQEVASRGITVNCVAPGFIVSPMTDSLNDEQKAAITNNIPSGTMGTPEDIGAAVAYLASSESGYVTGQTLHVNGGLAMI
ncbi:MAG: 3-oxoacyl-[acyl-carrier-protein] reductase [Rhodospirillaceae bacterium]|nr:3-oxoacyl-[acyl-carrier-protein] reductase [Rhodospirillaceae bacterium]